MVIILSFLENYLRPHFRPFPPRPHFRPPEIAEPSMKLQNPIALDSEALIAEVKKLRGKKRPLGLAAVRDLREEHARTIEPARALAAEARRLERQVSDLVNEAYGLTPEEVRLMWETAPPRMPIAPPPSASEGRVESP